MESEETLKSNISFYKEQIERAKLGIIPESSRSEFIQCDFIDVDEFIEELRSVRDRFKSDHSDLEVRVDQYTIIITGKAPHSEAFIMNFINDRQAKITDCEEYLKSYKDDRYEQYLQLKEEFEDGE